MDPCDVLVVIAARRYSRVRPGQSDGAHKRITWLDCENAEQHRKEVLAILLNPGAEWPPDRDEEYRATLAIKQKTGRRI